MQHKTLGEIISEHGGLIQTGPFGSQLHQHEYTESGTPVVMPKDIQNGRVDLSSIAHISDNKVQELKRHILPHKAIVMPRRGDVSKRAYINEDQAGILCGTGCIQVIAPENVLKPQYLYYYLEQRKATEWLEKNAVGTTMLNLSAKIIGHIPIVLISTDDQEKIIEILAAYDDLIENNRRRIQLLEQSARLLYKEWFAHLRFPGHEHVQIVDGIPDGWDKKPLSFVCRDIRKSISPEEVLPQTPYIGLEHIPRRSITLCDWGIAKEVNSKKFVFSKYDILFGRIRPYFHKVGLALTDGITSSDTIVIRPKLKDFYFYCLMLVSSDLFVSLASKTVKEGSKMPRADWKYLLKYRFIVPPDALLKLFNESLDPIISQLKILAIQNRQLATARDLLLPRLMNGEITI